MGSEEIRALTSNPKPKLALYALSRWENDSSHDPEPLLDALKNPNIEVVRKTLELAMKFHPRACSAAILGLLSHGDPVFRRTGVEALQPSLGPEASTRLKRLLGEELDPFVLASAVITAPRLGLGVEFLQKFLSHQDPRVRANTIRALVECPIDRRKILEPLLKDPHFRVQNEALKALCHFVTEAKLEEVILKRLASPEVEARASLAYFIGDFPLSRRIQILAKLLQDPEKAVRACALRGLSKLHEPIAWKHITDFYLSDYSNPLHSMLQRLLSDSPVDIFLGQIEKVCQPQTAPEDHLIKVLEVALHHRNWEFFMPWILGGLERREVQPRLLALELVKKNLAFFSTNLEDLLLRPEKSNDPMERALAAQIRYRSGRVSALETLKALLFDEKSSARIAAVKVLREESGLLPRRLLLEAVRSGISEAVSDHVDLPSPQKPLDL